MALDKIKEYGRRLEKYPEDKSRLKDTLHKLGKVAVTVEILEKTGIGKIVSNIKKRGDSAGAMAGVLIRKWRKIVDKETDLNDHCDHRSDGCAAGGFESSRIDERVLEVQRKGHREEQSACGEALHGSSSQQSSTEKRRYSSKGSVASDQSVKVEVSTDLIGNTLSMETKSQHSQDRSTVNQREVAIKKEEKTRHHNHSTKSKESVKLQRDRVHSKHDSKPCSSSSSGDQGLTLHNGGDSAPATRQSAAHSEASKVHRNDPEARDRKRKPSAPETDDGMNANNFGSFEDCLGSMESVKKLKRRKKEGNDVPSPKMTVTTSTLNGSPSKPKGPRLPDLVEKKPPELPDLKIPQLVTDYKPLPRVDLKSTNSGTISGSSSCHSLTTGATGSRRSMTTDEAVMFTSSRKDRTAVYSGRKQHTLTAVPTLYEACVRVLIEHVDLIEETGGVPFEIMRPIMERCTWQQLYNLEYHNPYLVDDSDSLWEVHARRDFRGKEPARGEETWRELYIRCHDEREQKLKSITASISRSMKARQAPVRMTKLAYVDSMAKPPRNVLRAQMKHGTSSTSSSRSTTSSGGNSSSSSTGASKTSSQPSQSRAIASTSSTAAATESVRAPAAAARKAKPAPLMAKTLSFLKMRRTTGYGFASR